MKPRQRVVLIATPVLEPAKGLLQSNGWRVVNRWDLSDEDRVEVDAILQVVGSVLEPDFLAALPKLELIASVSVGYDGIDLDWCRAHGVLVTHAKGVNADDVADHAIGLVIASWRGILTGDEAVRSGAWRRNGRVPFAPSLSGRRMGIVGLGAIGVAVARRAGVFGLEVAWWSPTDRAADWPRADTLLSLAAWSDILVVACRGDESTRGLVSKTIIEAVGPQGLLVNIARGFVIDEDALILALKEGRLGKAALDVFVEEPAPPERWSEAPNVLLSPHAAGATTGSIPKMLMQAVENIRLHFDGAEVRNAADGA